ncbi:hypothetical protein [Sulfuricurvum sp.]|uniref:hypothetical protein n=1 Tax=Sulfuricurvum sp. TaxID=2025608 RepID=UPI00356367A8
MTLITSINPMQWVRTFLIFSFLWIGTVFTVNYIVDPFGNREWIVEKKYKPIVHERSEKYNTIFNENTIHQYNCVILGSSRVMSMVPSANDTTKECYNFGVHVANNPEKLFILQEWLKHAPLKTVYIGNELYNMHPWLHPLDLNPNHFTHGSEGNYLSFSTLLMSYKVLKNLLKDQPQVYFETDGSIRFYPEEQLIRKGTFDHSYKHFKQISQEAVEGNFIQHPFTYEAKALEPLKKMKMLCDQHHVRLVAFITPTYYEAQIKMQSHPSLNAASQKFRKDLVNIFGNVYDFDVNTSENREPANFYDPVHYRPEIGNLMINRAEDKNSYGILFSAQKRPNSF